MSKLKESTRKAVILTIAGGLGFWAANFVISLTPFAAKYRAALSISYFPMLFECLVGGLIIGFCVSYFYLRFYDKLPARNPILKSVMLSFIVLIAVTTLILVPANLLTSTPIPLKYFLLGEIINVLRFLALGVVIGCLYGKLK